MKLFPYKTQSNLVSLKRLYNPYKIWKVLIKELSPITGPSFELSRFYYCLLYHNFCIFLIRKLKNSASVVSTLHAITVVLLSQMIGVTRCDYPQIKCLTTILNQFSYNIFHLDV
jgi:hypothetical protein